MRYEVIRYFTDLQDNNFAYNLGDTFPREGKEVSQARIDELSGTGNKQGRPLIRAVYEQPVISDEDFAKDMNPPTYDYSKNDIMRMPKDKLQSLGNELGIDDAFNLTGGALKPLIIGKLGL